MNFKELNLIFEQIGFRPRKHLGQNFLIDKNISNKFIELANLTKEDIVLEIGPGFGALTEPLARRANKIIAIEKDEKIFNHLKKKIDHDWKLSNIELVNEDILNTNLPHYDKVVSNIPYSITGPLLEKVLFIDTPPEAVITIEKRLADRIFSQDDDYKNISRITISVNSFMQPIEKHKISRKCFYPEPNIDISLIKMIPRENIDPFLLEAVSRSFYLTFLAEVMPYKNKNIVNALELFIKKIPALRITKPEVKALLKDLNYENKKLFTLKIADFILTCKSLHEFNYNK